MVKFNPENTAIATNKSKTAILLKEEGAKNILDYGCGKGRNIKYLQENGIIADGCDIPEQIEISGKYYAPLEIQGSKITTSEKVKKKYDYVLNSHVLNVIESDEIKNYVVKDINSKLNMNGKLYLEVRTEKDVAGAKSKEKYGDGWKIKCKGGFTYQEGITKEKMEYLLTSNGFKIEKHVYNSSTHMVIATKIA